MLLPLVLPLLFLLLVLLLLLPFVLLRSVFVSAFEIKSVFLNEYYFLKKEREREHELPCLSLERTRKRYIRKNLRERSFPSLASHDTNTNEHKDANERKALSSVHGRARARETSKRERERDDFDCGVEGGGIPMLYHAQKTNSLSLSLFSLPRFSCGTLSGASSHFALVASHSVSLPNIVGVVFCTRIRIRSSSGTDETDERFYFTQRKESRKSSSSSSSFLVCSFWEEEGRKALTKKTKKNKKKRRNAKEAKEARATKYILRESAGQKSK
mgnify:CR=1 FL=1